MGKYNKQRLFEMMGKVDPTFKSRLNEGDAFNDAGEPMMTHNQFRDYSEPSEPEYDDRDNPEMSYNFNTIIKELENRFNTILYGDNENKNFLSNKHDIMLYDENGKLELYIDTVKKYENYFDDVNIDELVELIKPYENTIYKGQDAEKKMNDIYRQDAADAAYARQERAAMGGGE